MASISLPNYVRRTGARFETPEEFYKASIIVNSTSQKIEKAGIPMMRIADNTYATSQQELHCFVIGDTGSGKTRRVIFPSVRILGKTGQSMIISDPKGEIYRKTSHHLRRNGYDVYIMNFRNPLRGNFWNPLDIVEKYYHSEDPILKEKSVTFLRDLADIMKNNVHSDNDVFWEETAVTIFIGIALLLLKYCPSGSLTFENISYILQEMFNEKNEGRARSLDSLIGSINELGNPNEIKEGLKPFINAPEKTAASIMSVMGAMLAPFTNNTAMKLMLSSTDFDINQLGEKSTALFLVLPDDSTFFYQIATVMVKQIYSLLIYQADSSKDGQLKKHVNFILDEFANFTPIDDFDAMLTAGRSRGITFTLVCQSMYQLEKKYGIAGSNILMDNCRVWIYLNSRNTYFLNKLTSLIGERHSPYTGERVPLIDTIELQHLEFGEVLVFNDRCYPMMGYLPDFSEYDFGDGLLNDETCEFPDVREYSNSRVVNVKTLVEQMTPDYIKEIEEKFVKLFEDD